MTSGTLQPKLNIGRPGDKYEREADRVAEQVMRMPGPGIQRQPTCPECMEDEEGAVRTKPVTDGITPLAREQIAPQEEMEEEIIHAKGGGGTTPEVTSGTESRIQSLKRSGRPLPGSTRAFFEPRFGVDFSRVRLHNDAEAAYTARSVNARAFTIGRNVVFGAGQYSPETLEGKSLLAHELTHTIQQGGASPGHTFIPQTSSIPPDLQLFGDPDEMPAGLACPPATDLPPVPSTPVQFSYDSSALSTAAVATIRDVVIRWHAAGGTDTVRLDGYASTEGSDAHNWTLACDRAMAVRGELMNTAGGVAGIPAANIDGNVFAHGETGEFSTGLPTNRRVLISGLPAPAAPVRVLTPSVIQGAVQYNQNRFSDPSTIQVIREVLGLPPTPAVVDEPLIRSVGQWQADRHMMQDGRIGHYTTRTLYFELLALGREHDAILLLMNSYDLPGSLHLNAIRVGVGANCCGNLGGADAVTYGGPHCPPVGGPVEICFCEPRIPQDIAEYNHFVRITGHELIHVPQCAVGTGNLHVDEFEAFYWEACAEGRMRRLTPTQRVNHANIALGQYASIPAGPLRTPARVAMRNRLNRLIAAGGVGVCH